MEAESFLEEVEGEVQEQVVEAAVTVKPQGLILLKGVLMAKGVLMEILVFVLCYPMVLSQPMRHCCLHAY